MGARRVDIDVQQRVHLALSVLSPHRPHGTITRLAEHVGVSRQTLYRLAATAEHLLRTGLLPDRHGAVRAASPIHIDRNRLRRASVVLTEAGISLRDVQRCLGELLDTQVSIGWVQTVLVEAEQAAAAVNRAWCPTVNELLAGDELFSNNTPNLLIVGNDSLYIYTLSQQPTCDGDTWGCMLLESPPCPQFASDGGAGIAAGVRAAEIATHQGDWDHVLRPLWGHVARLEAQAYGALTAVEERVTKFDRARTPGRLTQHFRAWERLQLDAGRSVAKYDAFRLLAEQVDSWFALIDVETGELRDPEHAAAHIRAVGQEIRAMSGGNIHEYLGTMLMHQAEALFRYQPVLARVLQPLKERWGVTSIQALARIWQLDADARRHPRPQQKVQRHRRLWIESLDTAVAAVGPEEVWTAWHAICDVLGRVWRGSMLAECINSRLRPRLDRRKRTDQGYLDLFRFLHNVRRFRRGKRAGQSPAERVGLMLPDDPLTLLGFAPKVSI